MKKGLIGFMVLAILSGMAMGEEKFSLRIGYKSDSWKAELKEKTRFLLGKGSNWKDELVLTDPDIEKSSIQYYVEAQYSPLSWLSFNATLGIGKTQLNFENLNFTEIHSWVWNGQPNSWEWKWPMDPVSVESEMEFFYGAGAEAQLYQNKNFGITLSGQYTYQKIPNSFRIYNVENEVPIYPFELFYWGRYVQVENSKIQEAEVKLNISTTTGKFRFSGGPTFFVAEIDHSGTVVEFWGGKDFMDPGLNQEFREENEIEFTSKNKSLFGLFAKISYASTENSEMFIRFSTGAKKALEGGISINL